MVVGKVECRDEVGLTEVVTVVVDRSFDRKVGVVIWVHESNDNDAVLVRVVEVVEIVAGKSVDRKVDIVIRVDESW